MRGDKSEGGYWNGNNNDGDQGCGQEPNEEQE